MFLLRRIKDYCHVMTNKTLCHPEFSSGSQEHEMLKQVQHDNELYLTFRKALAFTLAETLIVMGIIGVVAALTIPNLNSSTADKEKVAKLQKLYSNLEDAFGRAQSVYGPFDEWFINDTTDEEKIKRFSERLIEFMKISKNCGTLETSCFPCNYKSLDGGTYDNTCRSGYGYIRVLLADGAALMFMKNSLDVDIDGTKGANINGKDIFRFLIENNEVVPAGRNSSAIDKLCFSSGTYCTGWVIDTGNMDYLKADRTGKCPNGKVLNWTTNTSCK